MLWRGRMGGLGTAVRAAPPGQVCPRLIAAHLTDPLALPLFDSGRSRRSRSGLASPRATTLCRLHHSMSTHPQQDVCCLMGDPIAGNPTQYMLEKAFAVADLDWRFLTFE